MDIRTATLRAVKEGLFIRKRDRSDAFVLYVGAGSVYRFAEPHPQAGIEHGLDARDCVAVDWFLVDDDGREVA